MSDERLEHPAPRPEDGFLCLYPAPCACQFCEIDETFGDVNDTYEPEHSVICDCKACQEKRSPEERTRLAQYRTKRPSGPRPSAEMRAEEAEHAGTDSITRKGDRIKAGRTEKHIKRRRKKRRPETNRRTVKQWVRSQRETD